MELPDKLHVVLKRFSANTRLSVSEIICQYIRFLEKKHPMYKKLLDEDSDFNLKIDHP